MSRTLNRAFAGNQSVVPLTTMFGRRPVTSLLWRGYPGQPLGTLPAELVR